MMWTVHGFGHGGVDKNGDRQSFGDPRVVKRFRLHLHRLIHRALRLPGDYDPHR
ncbi:MAG: hypothetical protein HOV96_41615 [Nonomuraea sp.]|nr:hypothetical protein [Nonomuraea sp.]